MTYTIEKKFQREIQKEGLDLLVKNNGFKFTDTFFPYTSGEIGNYYVNSESIMKNGADYGKAITLMNNLVWFVGRETKSPVDIITGGETRDWVFSLPTANLLRLASTMICKDGRLIGAPLKGANVAHIADLNNEGSSPRDYWIPAIKKNGGKIKDIYFFVDRLEDGVKVMKDLELNSYSVVPLDKNAWDYLKEKGEISKEICKSIRQRAEDKDAWARNMLRSDIGIKRMAELIRDGTTREKALKIVNEGYPDMKMEIISRIKKEGLTKYAFC